MSEYIYVSQFKLRGSGARRLNEEKHFIAKRCPGSKNKYGIIQEVTNESDARFAVDALNEKHNFEYVTNKDS